LSFSFNTLLKLKGFPVKKASEFFNKISTVKETSSWQEEKCFEIFKYHFKNNSHYKTLVTKPIHKWSDIPILEKKDLRVDTSRNKTRYKKYYIRNTSGSTGTPFYYALDYFNHALTWMLFSNRYKELGISLNDKQARFFGSPSNSKENLKEKLKDYISNRHRFSLLDLSDRTFERWIKKFRLHRLEYIYGYSFPIISFCNYLKKQQIILKEVCPRLKAIIVTAETCSEQDEILIRETTKLPIANEYGASELGIIGFGETNKWKLSEELLYIEIVDESDNLVPDGQLGRIICTSLFNKATPFIRYDIGDLGCIETIDNKRYITKLEGRKEELMFLPSGRKLPGDTFFYYIIKDFAQKFKALIEYRVIQKTISDFQILIVASIDIQDKDITLLKKLIDNRLNEDVTILVSQVENIERSKMGKFRRFISLISN